MGGRGGSNPGRDRPRVGRPLRWALGSPQCPKPPWPVRRQQGRAFGERPEDEVPGAPQVPVQGPWAPLPLAPGAAAQSSGPPGLRAHLVPSPAPWRPCGWVTPSRCPFQVSLSCLTGRAMQGCAEVAAGQGCVATWGRAPGPPCRQWVAPGAQEPPWALAVVRGGLSGRGPRVLPVRQSPRSLRARSWLWTRHGRWRQPVGVGSREAVRVGGAQALGGRGSVGSPSLNRPGWESRGTRAWGQPGTNSRAGQGPGGQRDVLGWTSREPGGGRGPSPMSWEGCLPGQELMATLAGSGRALCGGQHGDLGAI